MTPIIIAVIVLALVFDFLNGIHDSSNVVATMISSRALSPRVALAMTAIANFIGPFIFGVAVADTIGHEVVSADAINNIVLLAALTSAIAWNLLTWYLGFPSSSSHALIGGFIGAVVIDAGWQCDPTARHRENLDCLVRFPHHWDNNWISPPSVDHVILLESHPGC